VIDRIDDLPLIHPGEILAMEYLVPLGLSPAQFAADNGMSESIVTGIVVSTQDVTADIALALGRACGTTPEFWLNLQAQYDRDKAGAP
jgi:addiction module HigA family antidote